MIRARVSMHSALFIDDLQLDDTFQVHNSFNVTL